MRLLEDQGRFLVNASAVPTSHRRIPARRGRRGGPWLTLRRWISVLLVVLMVSPGCSTTRRPDFVGTLRVAGENVTVNGRAVRDNTEIYNGDDVATGPRSSALLDFSDGGMVQLDENTDPRWQRSLVAPNRCSLLMSFDHGQFYAETPAVQKCGLRVEFPSLEPFPRTRFNLQAPNRSYSQLTVLDGRVDVGGPRRVTVPAAQQAELSGNRVLKTRPLSPEELRNVVAWRANYRFPTGVSWSKILMGAAILTVIGAVILLLVGHRDDKGSKPPPTPIPTPTPIRPSSGQLY